MSPSADVLGVSDLMPTRRGYNRHPRHFSYILLLSAVVLLLWTDHGDAKGGKSSTSSISSGGFGTSGPSRSSGGLKRFNSNSKAAQKPQTNTRPNTRPGSSGGVPASGGRSPSPAPGTSGTQQPVTSLSDREFMAGERMLLSDYRHQKEINALGWLKKTQPQQFRQLVQDHVDKIKGLTRYVDPAVREKNRLRMKDHIDKQKEKLRTADPVAYDHIQTLSLMGHRARREPPRITW
ncbi:hypothetical protein L249_4641 [Ophiocordyceps polyrhachis-furcata BCC 54312]|uniref:Uncharacterized protein n=1 Tax=Ophiocordyceps polyrhachis-furcata BCC 54312 TaxID=1330021 RepID=A0A367L2L2_9HYPO|nr:hypothetical protein L249_4641 [Ophiocordyceps polyrhachis-furcata BCC 54312]